MPKFSIISGIYNVSRFLQDKKLRCIIQQSYKDWELILVDDGSTDDSGRLCDELARVDCRIRVIHKKNEGLGSARNAGLDAALGEYVWFYDVDDEAHLELLEYCAHKMESMNLEMLQFGFTAITPSINLKEDVHLNDHLIETQEDFRDSYLDDILFIKYGNGFAWNKIIRRSFIEKHHLRYENQRIQQDEVFNLKIYPLLQRVYLSSDVLYDYYIYEKGNTRARFIPDRFDIYKSVRKHFEELKDFWSLNDIRFNDYLEKRFYTSVMQCMSFNLTHPNCKWTKQQKKDEMERIMSDRLTIQSFKYADTHERGLEQRLYRKACRNQSLFQIKLYTSLFDMFHKTRKLLKK